MKIYIYVTYFLFLSNSYLFGQKNTFSIVYTPAITKLNTNYLAKNMVLNSFSYWYSTRKPDKPMYGFNVGFTYGRKISNKITINTGLFYTELKQQTGNFYGDKEFDKPPINYLASDLVFKYTGIEIPITLTYLLTQSDNWASRLEVGTSFNLIDSFEAQDYVIGLKSGRQEGCCTSFLYSKTSFATLNYKLSKPYFFRLGFSIGYELDYNLGKYWQLSFTPLFKYYSNALEDKNISGALDADAYFLGLQSKINFNF
jgi:hypothetical protein